MAVDIHDYVRHITPHENIGGDRLRGGGWANTCVHFYFVSYFFYRFFYRSFYRAKTGP